VKLRLRRQETGRGEWSVFDPLRGYRLCRFNHLHHEGTHVHHPENEVPLASVDVNTPQEAEIVMRRYHDQHEAFNLTKLKEVIDTWKSESADA
jgi:hypothetical protein